ncbi:isocitrate lyase/PEP mutase family protein [Saccharomonospora halophila]|uniref:isocitrate lyase/PEP mutase family protein n=1 Tax=Saccharomonospora halophila TaxID=129922 RepID=UPI00037FA729|nr:isocitrate lyase/phosphoenolpyruvate mutase family protein [Saccharomonospora halophila]
MSDFETFRALHHTEDVLLLPNAWDAGSARILRHLGFRAVATTSSGAAAARGLPDGALGRDEVLAHCAELVGAVDVPVSADLENGFADSPEGVSGTVRRARDTGLAGVSVEDWSGTALYDRERAVERVRAAVEAAAGELVVTARAENHFRGVDDLHDTVARLRAFRDAGADVVYAPGVLGREQIAAVVEAVDIPVNVLARPGVPPVGELAELGVRRVSVGGGLAFAAYQALADAAGELWTTGTYGFLDRAAHGGALARESFASRT